ncbi:ABC transporter permease [Paramaledivibacter caminithermalis]|uniref:ABC-2 family transporter protein n=1 Tax=Paramaledivibacter caminithermalis (strain DSM 15212 / CIP 107654 / DViRD3) TaxID=1121301 RepID=A0A1M6RL77_PARC5|nr:ABC transporter permease [Paramaledivibacter caminithermalis]SHK33176.1 ABC-2 family transporter protein [Paramaledivibacter caminithermalis DSM 15212]
MKTLLRIKIKEQFFKKSNIIMLLIIPLVIAYICICFNKETRDPSKVYSAAIIDHDKSEFSFSFINNMKEYREIDLYIQQDIEESLRRLSRGKYDVVYEIKDGFQSKILMGEFDDILISHKEVNSTAVKWLNDQVSLIVVRKWLYVDVLSRIHSLDPDFKEEEFKERFKEAMTNNKILSLKITNINNESGILEDSETKDNFVFKILWGTIIIFFIISFGKKTVDDRERGIITRLELCGLNKLQYYVTNLLLLMLNIMIPFTISYFIVGFFSLQSIISFINVILFTIFYTICTWLIIILIGLIFNSKKSYGLASQVYLLVSMILGSELLDGMSRLINYASWLFPIKWYMYFKI